MKPYSPLLPIIFLAATTSFLHANQDKFPIKLLSKAPESEEETFYPVKEGEVQVKGTVIRELGINGERVTVAYKNTTTMTIIPPVHDQDLQRVRHTPRLR